jgi:hypothetical protein
MGSDSAVHVGAFEAVFRQVRLPMGLVVDEVRLAAVKGLLDKDPFQIHLEKPGTLLVRVLEKDLEAFLEKEAPGGLRDFEVSAKDGRINVCGTLKMIFDLRAAAICTLRIVNQRRLFVDLESVDVMGVGAKSLVEAQLEKINPVLDVEELPFEVLLDSVTIEPGVIVLTGTAMPK